MLPDKDTFYMFKYRERPKFNSILKYHSMLWPIYNMIADGYLDERQFPVLILTADGYQDRGSLPSFVPEDNDEFRVILRH